MILLCISIFFIHEPSYARKLVTACSVGWLNLLDSVNEGNALNDLWHAV
jgi:hypothetical protein